MNETIAKIMEFINNNTLVLIGICVFLILVLIGYLIDNSVKSKRVRNDIKNPDQVPEVIKDAIIKKAEREKEEEIENKTIKDIVVDENAVDNVSISDSGIIGEDINQSQETLTDMNSSLDLDSTLNMNPTDLNLETQNEVNNTDIIDTTPETEPIQDNTFDIDISTTEPADANEVPNDLLFNDINVETPTSSDDPDYNIMNNVPSDNGYSNDKKLSEILMGTSMKEEPIKEENNSTIFSDNSSGIVINNDVQKDDVQIETKENDSSDELDRIMRKLSAMNTNIEEDNYTNIF